MAWSNQQKQIAVRACKAAGIDEEQRREMILRHFPNARLPDGRISSTAAKLNNEDFEQFMAIVETHAGGQVLHFTRAYWQGHAQDRWQRMRHRALAIAADLEAAGRLHPDGVGLRGWIAKRVTQGQTDQIEALDYHQLRALIVSLDSYARQNGVTLARGTSAASSQQQGTESHECAAT